MFSSSVSGLHLPIAELRKRVGSDTNQICFVPGRHHLTGISAKKLFGIHHHQARVQEVPTDFKFQGKMSIIPRQRKTVQPSLAVHLSKQRIILELRKIR